MTKDDLLTLVTREDPFSDEERAQIQAALNDLDVSDAYDILMKVNEIGNEPQKELMVFLSEDTLLYERISEFVREKNESDEESDEEDEEDELDELLDE